MLLWLFTATTDYLSGDFSDCILCLRLRVHPLLWPPLRWLKPPPPRWCWELRWSWMAPTTYYGRRRFTYSLALRINWLTSYSLHLLIQIPRMWLGLLEIILWWYGFSTVSMRRLVVVSCSYLLLRTCRNSEGDVWQWEEFLEGVRSMSACLSSNRETYSYLSFMANSKVWLIS